MAKKQIKSIKKAVEKKFTTGRVYVTATFNNTLVTLTDNSGNTLAWGSAGASGFKGARKATPFAGITAVEGVAQKGKSFGMSQKRTCVIPAEYVPPPWPRWPDGDHLTNDDPVACDR